MFDQNIRKRERFYSNSEQPSSALTVPTVIWSFVIVPLLLLSVLHFVLPLCVGKQLFAAVCSCIAAASCGEQLERFSALEGRSISGWSQTEKLSGKADLQNPYVLLINPSQLIQVFQQVTKLVI